MPRKGYRYGVEWIAFNDDPNEVSIEDVSGFISVLLLADLFCKDPKKVAEDIVNLRVEEARRVANVRKTRNALICQDQTHE